MERYVEEKKPSKHMTTKVLVGVQLLLSASFLIGAKKMDIVPAANYVLLAVALAALFVFCFVMLFVKHKINVLGLWLSVLTCVGMGIGVYYLAEANTAISAMVGSTYKTEELVVVVRAEDSAKTIQDAKKYTFAQQKPLDDKSNKLTVNDIHKRIGKNISITQYATLNEVVDALLTGKVDAVIYNDAFSAVISQAVGGYADKVKTIHRYTVKTKIEQNEDRTIAKPFNIYISGVDVSGSLDSNSKSNLNIIATVNPITKQILLTTTPPNFYVQLPGISGEQKDKLSHAGMYGIEKAVNTLEKLYNIKIDYYAKLNFASLIDVVDLLGGIDVQLTHSFSKGDVHFEKGLNHMNGEQALAFSRVTQEGSDISARTQSNQGAVLDAMMKKVMLPVVLKKADVLIGNVSESVKTNMTKGEMKKLIRMQLETHSSWDVNSVSAVGVEDFQGGYSYPVFKESVINPDMGSINAIKEKMRKVQTGIMFV